MSTLTNLEESRIQGKKKILGESDKGMQRLRPMLGICGFILDCEILKGSTNSTKFPAVNTEIKNCSH